MDPGCTNDDELTFADDAEEKGVIEENTTIEVKHNGPIWLVVACNIAMLCPDDTIGWFVDPEKLRRWWGHEHEIAPRIGGDYIIHWPAIERTLRGQIADIGDRRLMFSWAFDHESDLPPRMVAITVSEVERGSRIEIRHGPYRDGDVETADRQGHLEGWSYFLPKLAAAVDSENA